MTLATEWARHFGLASVPLFADAEQPTSGTHRVLLDGGFGTFALSETNEELWRTSAVNSWAWSSDVAHHVTATSDKVAVARWDGVPEVFTRKSILEKTDEFYRYLCKDRIRSTDTVVNQLLLLFRKIRSLAADALVDDHRTIDLFLSALARLIQGLNGTDSNDEQFARAFGLAADGPSLLRRLNEGALNLALSDVQESQAKCGKLDLSTSLAVRHAGGLLFQEAHFELLRAPSVDMFGYVGEPAVRAVSRGGAHFTPPALARILTDLVFADLGDLSDREHIEICDPACGSAAFLHEALRALRRGGFSGRVIVHGFDISPAALAMAEFTLQAAKRDWQPDGGIEINLRQRDALEEGSLPKVDAIVMNPPFIAWQTQTAEQRARYSEALQAVKAPRGDLSMAFVIRALDALKEGGVVGSLFPASLLALEAAEHWRHHLLENADLKFLGSIGDYGLFSHALVQVACAVARKPRGPSGKEQALALVTENNPDTTGNALRWVRKATYEATSLPVLGEGWSLFPLSIATLKQRTSWRLIPPRTEAALRRLLDAGLPTIGDLFDVNRGVQTGLNSALLLTEEEWRALPPSERKYFRIGTMTDSIVAGQITKPYHVFFPHSIKGQLFESEADVQKAVPRFFALYLQPNKDRLQKRIDITRPNRTDWWGLAYPRAFSTEGEPRILSKYFSGVGGFVLDLEAAFLPVMGFAWFLKEGSGSDSVDTDEVDGAIEAGIDDLLSAYCAMFNSDIFMRLVEIYCPHVSGGQFDLSPRYINSIPIPHLSELSVDVAKGRIVSELTLLGRNVDTADQNWRDRSNWAVTSLLGSEFVEAL